MTPLSAGHETRQGLRWPVTMPRVVCALAVLFLVGAPSHVSAGHVPKESFHLTSLPRDLSAAMLLHGPRAREGHHDGQAVRPLVASSRQPAASEPLTFATQVTPQNSGRSRSVSVPFEKRLDANAPSAASHLVRFDSDLVGQGPGGVVHLKLPGLGTVDPHHLTRQRARQVIDAVVRSVAIRLGRENSQDGSKAQSARARLRSPLAAESQSMDSPAESGAAAPSHTTEEVDGASQVEVHWSADELGLSTFVGGSRSDAAACSTAFGREVAAEAGLQFLDSASRAYRVVVAQSFKNDLAAPVEEARFQFEWNIRF
ncbi:MAG: hypothetical protein P8N09_06300 [Planctomycetota bacterium]|nr:hypothetical protein [Planctomycetota bacterium]